MGPVQPEQEARGQLERAGNPARASRSFNGSSWDWDPPLAPGFSGHAGRTIPVKFHVNDLAGAFVRDTSVTVDLVNASGQVVVGPVAFGTDPATGVAIEGRSTMPTSGPLL